MPRMKIGGITQTQWGHLQLLNLQWAIIGQGQGKRERSKKAEVIRPRILVNVDL